MTHEEAGNIVAVLNAGFPNSTLERESVAIYAKEIALLHDYAIGTEAAWMTVRQGDRFPTIKEFRSVYRSVADRRRSEVPALEEGPRGRGIPEWVQVWWWARHIRIPRELRDFPQQHDWHNSPTMATVDYDALRAEWAAAGSPRIGVGEIMASLAA